MILLAAGAVFLLILPPQFYAMLAFLLPALMGFAAAGLKRVDDADAVLRCGLRAAGSGCITGLALLGMLSLLGVGGVSGGLAGLIIAGISLAAGGALGAFLGALLMPARRTLITGAGGAACAFTVIMLGAWLRLSLWPLILIIPAAAAVMAGRDSPDPARAGGAAGMLAGLPLALAISAAARVISCLGADSCAAYYGAAGLLMAWMIWLPVLGLHYLVGCAGGWCGGRSRVILPLS